MQTNEAKFRLLKMINKYTSSIRYIKLFQFDIEFLMRSNASGLVLASVVTIRNTITKSFDIWYYIGAFYGYPFFPNETCFAKECVNDLFVRIALCVIS